MPKGGKTKTKPRGDKPNKSSRLNIFIDETGEFGFSKTSARFYGISLVFHEQRDSIADDVKFLDKKLAELNFRGMMHMGDLINGHGDYTGKTIAERKKRCQKSLTRSSVQFPLTSAVPSLTTSRKNSFRSLIC